MREAGVTPLSHPGPGFLDLINYELIQAYCYKPLNWEVLIDVLGSTLWYRIKPSVSGCLQWPLL